MKLLVLGGSYVQLNAIRKAKEKGHTVIITDYLSDCPGKREADFYEQISTFDVEGNIKVGKKYEIDGVLTLGTDQPILTAAKVAEALEIPAFLDSQTAKSVTNKRVMKNLFYINKIPTAKYRLIKEGFKDNELQELNFPVVVKPLDSQGQRGVYKLSSIEDIRKVFGDVISFSREDEILVEEFYENDEITVNGWVVDGKPYIFSVVDRISCDQTPHIGVCIRHNMPSVFMAEYSKEITLLTEKIVQAFNIKNGPIYFQFLMGNEGIKVNEIACRIGGAYEDQYIPRATGINILDMLIDYSLGLNLDYSTLNNFDINKPRMFYSVEMFFAKPCKISYFSDIEMIKKLPGVIKAHYNFDVGHCIKEINNATQRAGYIIVEGKSKNELVNNIEKIYYELGIYDENGENKLIRF